MTASRRTHVHWATRSSQRSASSRSPWPSAFTTCSGHAVAKPGPDRDVGIGHSRGLSARSVRSPGSTCRSHRAPVVAREGATPDLADERTVGTSSLERAPGSRRQSGEQHHPVLLWRPSPFWDDDQALAQPSSVVHARWLAAREAGVADAVAAMPDLRHEVQEVVTQGDVEMARVVVTGTLLHDFAGVLGGAEPFAWIRRSSAT